MDCVDDRETMDRIENLDDAVLTMLMIYMQNVENNLQDVYYRRHRLWELYRLQCQCTVQCRLLYRGHLFL